MRWQPVKAIAVRQALVLRRSPHRLFDVTVWPLVDTLLFGSLAVFFQRGGGSAGRVVADGSAAEVAAVFGQGDLEEVFIHLAARRAEMAP